MSFAARVCRFLRRFVIATWIDIAFKRIGRTKANGLVTLWSDSIREDEWNWFSMLTSDIARLLVVPSPTARVSAFINLIVFVCMYLSAKQTNGASFWLDCRATAAQR